MGYGINPEMFTSKIFNTISPYFLQLQLSILLPYQAEVLHFQFTESILTLNKVLKRRLRAERPNTYAPMRTFGGNTLTLDPAEGAHDAPSHTPAQSPPLDVSISAPSAPTPSEMFCLHKALVSVNVMRSRRHLCRHLRDPFT